MNTIASPYDKVYEENTIWSKIKYVRAIIYPFIMHNELIRCLKKNKNKYDIIDFHWMIAAWVLFPNSYLKHSKNIIGTFWGAEWNNMNIFLSNKLYKMFLKRFLEKAKFIVSTTDHTKNELAKLVSIVNSKYRYAYFGSAPLACLERLIETETREISKKKMKIDSNKLSVVIGYSGKHLHNHLSIIKTLQNCQYSEEFKAKLELIAPMTYGCNNQYTNSVEDALEKSGFSYRTFKGYFSNEDVARLRNATDIILQLANSDAASRSILEFLIAGSVMISGSWINYQYFKNEGFIFTEIDEFEVFPAVLLNIINNFQEAKIKAFSNKENGRGKYSWQNCIGAWKKNYEDCCE